MNIFFIICAALCFTAAIILLIIRKIKKSTLAGNLAFILIIISLLSIGCYSLNINTLFKKNYSAEFRQPATSAATTERNNGRPVKKDSDKPKSTENHTIKNTNTVYITRNGEKYHLSYSCGNNEYYECTLEQALNRGLSPCKKCAQ